MQPPNQGNPYPQPNYQQSNNQTVIIQQTTTEVQTSKYRLQEKVVLVHGAMQLVIGLLCVIFNIVLICLASQTSFYGTSAYSGSGFWCGVLFVITGSFGIAASKCKSACTIIAYMVLCILSSLMAVVIFGFGCSHVTEGQMEEGSYYHIFYEHHRRRTAVGDTFIGLGSIIIIMSVTEFVVSIWSSALCCAAVCCCRDTHGVVHNVPQQQTVQLNPGNPMVYIHTNTPGTYYPTQQAGVGYPGYPQPQTTYVGNQGAPPPMAAAPQPVGPPAYNQEQAPPPYYNHDYNPTAPQPSSGQQYSTNTHLTKNNMSAVEN